MPPLLFFFHVWFMLTLEMSIILRHSRYSRYYDFRCAFFFLTVRIKQEGATATATHITVTVTLPAFDFSAPLALLTLLFFRYGSFSYCHCNRHSRYRYCSSDGDHSLTVTGTATHVTVPVQKSNIWRVRVTWVTRVAQNDQHRKSNNKGGWQWQKDYIFPMLGFWVRYQLWVTLHSSSPLRMSIILGRRPSSL